MGRLRYSSSSEKYSVLRYFRTVVVSNSSEGEVGSSVGSVACGVVGFDIFLEEVEVVDREDVEDEAVFGRIWGEERFDAEEEGREVGVEGRPDTRLRSVLGVAGSDFESREGGGELSISGASVGIPTACSLGWLKLEMVSRAVGGLARVEEVSFAELDRFLVGVVLAGGGCGFLACGMRFVNVVSSLRDSGSVPRVCLVLGS